MLQHLVGGSQRLRGDRRSDIRRGERLRLENLERRQLLAGDVGTETQDVIGPVNASDQSASLFAASATSGLTAQTTAEGEPAPDLVQFAKDLETAGVVFYGAHWCPACTQQKELFEDGGDNLPFVEVTNPDRTIGQVGIDNNITAYPTWVFPDQSRETGVLTLQQLSQRSGVAIPNSEEPSFEEIGNQTALIGSPLHIPIDAYDPNGGPLTVTVSVADSSLLEASVVTGNRSIRIDMETYGDMVFELFEQRAPRPTSRVIELANDEFYDDIIFHRLVDGFVIQAGDPTGTGTGGSTLGDFDDQFHPELQHNRRGVLSYAKSSDDTNDSQFFITEVPTRFLDFNHSVFGQLVEGEDVREAISNHAVNSSDRPTTDIAINTIEVFTDTENSVVMLKPTGNGVGSTNVTITVTDQDGNAFGETFQVDVNNDTANSQPFLNEVQVPNTFPINNPATLQLSSTDIEGDAVTYSAAVVSSSTGATATISQNGLLTVTPATGFTGTVDVRATVAPGAGVTGNSNSDSDNQVFQFTFEGEQTPNAPTSIDLLASSDSGSSDSDNITNSGSLSFQVDGVTDGATVQLINTQTSAVIGQAVASGTSVVVTTNNIAALGDGTYSIAARQSVGGVNSPQTSALSITYDTVAPASVAAGANTRANVNRAYQTDLINAEEGSVTYALTTAPSGATINSGSGVIDWTPQAADLGDNDFTVTTTDIAGNVRTDDFTVTVSGEPLAEVKLVARNSNGDVINNVSVGQTFVLELVGVDARGALIRDGVFAMYADILFDSNIVRPVAGSTIEYVGDFTLSSKGSFLTGLIDELGAASNRTQATDEAESLIARVQMEAVASGTVNIRSEEADEASSEILLYGEDNQIAADDIFFGSVSLTVGLDFALVNDQFSVAEDSGATTLDVLTNDTNSGSGTLSIVSVTQPASGGTVSVNSGVINFTPDANFNGTTEFTYRAGDGSGAQDTATVTVTVTSVNDPPSGVADTFNVIENSGANRLDVLANDTIGPDTGETLSVTAVSGGNVGATIAVTSDNAAVNYTPASGFTGSDTFSYTVSDGTTTSTVNVTVTVAPDDDPPTAVDDSFTVTEDAAEASYDVLQNDQRDGDNEAFVISSVGTPSQGGSVRFSNDGSTFFYAPSPNFNGTETVSYTIRDTGGGLSVATATFTVTAVNDPPPVVNETIRLNAGVGQTEILALADLPANPDSGETLSFVLPGSGNSATTTAGGTVSINSSGNLQYTPPSASFTGTDTINYSVSDGSGTNASGSLTVEILELTERNVMVRFSSNQAKSVAGAVRLTGTDALGASVDMTPTVDDANNLMFEDLLPGEYVIEIPAVPFFSGGESAQRFEISSAPEDGDASVQSSLGRIKPEYMSMMDWLGSSLQQSALVVVEPGQSARLTLPNSASEDSITDPVVAMNEAGTQLTINGQKDVDPSANDGAETVAAMAAITRTDIVQPRGEMNGLRLYRLDLDDGALSYSESAASSSAASSALAAGAGGEGEAAVPPASAGLSAAGNGEGEAAAAASSEIQVAAPLLSVGTAEGEGEGDENEPETPVSTVSTTDPVRRLSASSAAHGDAPRGAEDTFGDSDSQVDTTFAGQGTDAGESPLSPLGVDRFFRRIR